MESTLSRNTGDFIEVLQVIVSHDPHHREKIVIAFKKLRIFLGRFKSSYWKLWVSLPGKIEIPEGC